MRGLSDAARSFKGRDHFRGSNIYSREVEGALRSTRMYEVSVIGRADPEWGKWWLPSLRWDGKTV